MIASQIIYKFATKTNYIPILLVSVVGTTLVSWPLSKACLYCIGIDETVFTHLATITFFIGLYYPSITFTRKSLFGECATLGKFMETIRVPVFLITVLVFNHTRHEAMVERLFYLSILATLATFSMTYLMVRTRSVSSGSAGTVLVV